MYLLVNEGELSTYGPGARFGSLIFDVLGVTPVDKDIKASGHGQPVSYEYINEKNLESSMLWTEVKQSVVNQLLRKHYQMM